MAVLGTPCGSVPIWKFRAVRAYGGCGPNSAVGWEVLSLQLMAENLGGILDSPLSRPDVS